MNHPPCMSASLSRGERITGSYLMIVGFYTPVWSVPSSAKFVMPSLSLSRGARISIVLTVIRVTPWRLQKKILSCSTFPSSTSFPSFANRFSLGVVAFFVVQYLVLLLQGFWICELTCPQWKDIPGSICILPEAVPITQIISMPPRFLVSFSVLIESTPSNGHFRWHLGFHPLDGARIFLFIWVISLKKTDR